MTWGPDTDPGLVELAARSTIEGVDIDWTLDLPNFGIDFNGIGENGVPTNFTTESSTTRTEFTLAWMRNRRIYFHAEGLLPNTKYTPYFDGVDVSQWCREEASMVEFSDTTNDWQDVRSDLTQHPDTSGELIANSTGEIIGSFWLPNTGIRDEFVNESQAQLAREAFLVRKNSLIASLAVSASDPQLYDLIGWKFEVGSKKFELMTNREDYFLGNFYSWAETNYEASGRVRVRQNTIVNTPVVTPPRLPNGNFRIGGFDPVRRGIDPLAQTFFVGTEKYPGIFLTGIDLFVRSAPEATETQLPLEVQIRGTRDGVPLSDKLNNNASAFINAADVRAAITGQDTGDATSIIDHPVHLDFDEPVFLRAGEQYAFVIKSDTPSYEVFYATTTHLEIGSSVKRIFKQPATGSMFTSQNASTWTPDQNSDLAYKLYTAKFKTSGTVKLKNVPAPRKYLDNETCFIIDSASTKLFVEHPISGLQPGDRPRLLGLDSATKYGGILGASIMDPLNQIDSADVTGFTILLDSAATSNAIFGNTSVTVQQNFMMDEIYPLIDMSIIEQTKAKYSGRFTSGISYANDVRITNLDARFDLDNNFTDIFPNTQNRFSNPRMIANDSAETNDMSGASSVLINIDITSDNISDAPYDVTYTSNVSPILDLERMTAVGHNNIIDHQDSAPSASPYRNTPTNYVAETNPLSGTSLSKHIIKPVTMPSDAVGLKILFDGHRPPAADFDVYYRTTGGDQNIYDIPWVELSAIVEDPTKYGTEGAISKSGYPDPNPIPTTDENTFFSGYEYFAGDQYGQGLYDLPSFTQYQVKVVLKSTNTSQVPLIDNLRIIALAV
jgi:hypothetical protein